MTTPCPNCVETIAKWLDNIWSEASGDAVRDRFLPKSPAQLLAEECPHGMTEEQAQWVLDRESNLQKTQIATDAPLVDKTTVREVNEKLGNCTPTDAAPRYVFGPVLRDVSLNYGDLYIWEGDYEKIIRQVLARTTLESNFRRAYRIGQTYGHDGGECPLADGSVRVDASGPDYVAQELPARVIFWDCVTRFTILDGGSGQ